MAPTLQKLGHKARKLVRHGFQPSNFRILRKETTALVHVFYFWGALAQSMTNTVCHATSHALQMSLSERLKSN